MAYLGKSPVVGNFQKCDAITVVNGQAGYTLQVGGSNVSPESANHMLVSLNGILQAPTSSFTVSGATLTFVSNLATGDVIDFVMLLGNVLDIGTPSDSTVSLAKLTATGTASSSTFLRGDNSWASAGGANTPAFEAYLSATQAITHDTITKVTLNTEVYDTDGCYDNSSNYRFTPTTAGKYFTYGSLDAQATTEQLKRFSIYIYKNGSAQKISSNYFTNNEAFISNLFIGTVIDMNGSSDYVELFVKLEYESTGALQVNGGGNGSFFGAYKIIGA